MQKNNAIILGKHDENIISAEGYQHILLLAPHGSGKGVCFVLPTLLTLEESCIVHDIKLENYELTSGYRASIGHKIFVFNPLATKDKTHRYNPLDFISADQNQMIDDIQKIAYLLISGSPACKTLFVGLVLYLSAMKKIKSLGEIARMVQRDLVLELSADVKNLDKVEHEYCLKILSSFLNRSTKTQNNIVEELNDCLYLWNNPLIDYATSESDFDIASLKTTKTTIYVGVNPTDINRIQPLMNLFYNHVFTRLSDSAQYLGYGEENGGVSILLDEFYSIGQLDQMTSCMPYFRGSKIRLFLISSDLGKIEMVYGKEQANCIISDCTFKVAFAPNDYKTAALISAICLDKKDNKELLSWQQIMNLSTDSQIILFDKKQPTISKKVKYYDDEKLKKKVIAPVIL